VLEGICHTRLEQLSAAIEPASSDEPIVLSTIWFMIDMPPEITSGNKRTPKCGFKF
jgi:hypothetical protein